MRKYVISCCTPVDLNRETLERHNIRYVYFHFSLGNDFYDDDFGETVPPAEMYRRMLAGEESKTSRKIYVIDSLQASAGYGMFVLKAAELRDAGLDAEEVAGWLEKHKPEEESWFFSTDLTFFIRGGRISKTAGMIGSVLGICPLMRVNKEGKLEIIEKVRTKKRVYRRVADQLEKLAAGGREYSGPVFISNSECPEDAKAVAAIIEERFPGTKGKIHISSIGSTIGAHTGPGTVATFFWGTPGRT